MRQLTPVEFGKAYAAALNAPYEYVGIGAKDQSNLASMTAFLLDRRDLRTSIEVAIQSAMNFWPETVAYTIVTATLIDPADHPPLPDGATILASPLIAGYFNLA